jgi:eukaryotic-like serine/threonine-protein kinase
MTEVADNTLIDGRYRIVSHIGSGGMADVYCAQDIHLGREVALKILHRRFAQDSEFVERFRREASSAAGLQHPNVVAVFDRGEHEGTYYIAMEHLRGRPLKDIVGSEAPLPQQQAIDLAVQILHAASFAHRHGVIHRDFKPHNVIVDGEGNVKVTDFGIARAGASEMTETGSIMGTAQYLSPEQAEGQAVTAGSDLYSVGVMAYEMLTGQLPFDGDTAVSVALKHVSEPPPPMSALRRDINPVLESVVMGALAKDPAARWQSADEFAAALEAAKAHVEAGSNGGQDTAAWAPLPPLPPGSTDPTALQAPPLEPLPPLGPLPDEEERRRRRWPIYALGLAVLAFAGLLAFMALSGLLAGPKTEVPNVLGRQLVQARASLEREGFEVRETRVRSAQEFDQVVDQDPNAGEDAREGSTVTLEVSNGPGNVRVPSVEDLPQARAVKELTKVDLKANIDTEPSDSVRKGVAIRTVPREGTEVERGTRVRLFVSSGPEEVTVPDVTGLSRTSAESRLEGEGLEVAVEEQDSSEPQDQVIAQEPGGGTRVERGQRVTITVSSGREQVRVPNVVGLPPDEAAGELRAEGLDVVKRERAVSDPGQEGTVIDQRPRAGADVDRGRAVVIVVGRLEQPAPGQQPGQGPPPQ